jgi:AraC-like DNA-binding protein
MSDPVGHAHVPTRGDSAVSTADLLADMSRGALRHAEDIALETMVPRLGLGIVMRPRAAPTALTRPMIALVLQGTKQSVVGNRVYHHGTGSCFGASIEFHASGCIVEADPVRPFVCATLELDGEQLAAVLATVVPACPGKAMAPMAEMVAGPDLLDAWQRYLMLLDAPADIPMLAELRERELLYRLLHSRLGPMLRQFAHRDSRLSRVRRAIDWIRAHANEPIRTESLADIAAMSVPAFHRHFKAATAMTPLQFQKALRLQEARRLLLADSDVTATAFAVGYESASQFSREYSRMFGIPPSRTARQLQDA